MKLLNQASARRIYAVAKTIPPLKRLMDLGVALMTPSRFEDEGAIFNLNPKDLVIGPALYLHVYEVAERNLLRRIVKPGMSVIDIGANIGIYSVLFSKWCAPGGQVVAFEPDSENLSFLEKNIAENALANVRLRRSAVADKAGTSLLFKHATNKGDHRLYPVDGAKAEEVRTETVDDALRELGVDAADVVKIDIQGFERKALRGMEKTISQSPRLKILTEFYPEGLRAAGDDPREMIAFFTGRGFEVSNLNERTGALEPVGDPAAFVASLSGSAYTNLFCAKTGAGL